MGQGDNEPEAFRSGVYNAIMAAKARWRRSVDDGSLGPVATMQRWGWSDPRRAAREQVAYYRQAGEAYLALADDLARIGGATSLPLVLAFDQDPAPLAPGKTRVVASCRAGAQVVWEVQLFRAPASGRLPADFVWSVHMTGQPPEVVNTEAVARRIALTKALARFAGLLAQT